MPFLFVPRRTLVVAGFAAVLACAGSRARHRSCVSPGAPSTALVPLAITPSWTDRSPHREAFVAVPGATLHYLDWGGPAANDHAEGLVFLAGVGQGAHILDDLAPQFANCFRTIAITRRGVAPSSMNADSGYTINRLADDILAVLDSLGIQRANLVGHSFAGAEITRIAATHPERVTRLVYLDATTDLGASSAETEQDPVPRPLPPVAERNFQGYRPWLQRVFYGFWSNALEADLRAVREVKGTVEIRETKGDSEETGDWTTHPSDYTHVQAPALAFLARRSVATRYPWLDPVRDSAAYAKAQHYLDFVELPSLRRGWDRFRRELPTARVIELESHHHIFIAHADTVANAMLSFLLSAP